MNFPYQLQSQNKSKKSHTGLIVVLIFGFLVALGFGLFLFYEFYWKKKKTPTKKKESYKNTDGLQSKIQLHSVNYDYVPNTLESRPQLFVETYNGDIPNDISLFSNVMLDLKVKTTPYPPKSEREYTYVSNRLNSSSYRVKDISGPYIILESDTIEADKISHGNSPWGYTVDGDLLYSGSSLDIF